MVTSASIVVSRTIRFRRRGLYVVRDDASCLSSRTVLHLFPALKSAENHGKIAGNSNINDKPEAPPWPISAQDFCTKQLSRQSYTYDELLFQDLRNTHVSHC